MLSLLLCFWFFCPGTASPGREKLVPGQVKACEAIITASDFREKYCPFLMLSLEDAYELGEKRSYILQGAKITPDGEFFVGFEVPIPHKTTATNPKIITAQTDILLVGSEFGFVEKEKHLYAKVPGDLACFLKYRCKKIPGKEVYQAELSGMKATVSLLAHPCEKEGKTVEISLRY